MIPTVDFFGNEVSRLLVGGNPFSGHSYIPSVTGEEMLDYYTMEHVIQSLFSAEKSGYTTSLLLSDDFTIRMLREYRNRGGRLNWIAQTHPPILLESNIISIMKQDPIAIFHQGTMTDELYEEGNLSQLRDNIKMIKDTGKPVGLSTHVPEVILRAEDEGWGVDFYMACVHNMRKRQRYQSSFITGIHHDFTFYAEDREQMFKVIRQVKKPCVAFKILSGGHLCKTPESLETAFKETYDNIKPCDLAVVGVFQKYKNEIAQNAEMVARLLAAAKG